MDMFTISFCGIIIYSIIAGIISWMDNINVRKDLVDGTAWVGYTLLVVGVISSIVMLFL